MLLGFLLVCPSASSPALTACLHQLGLDMSYWTVVTHVFVWGSLTMYFVVTFTMYSNGMYLIFTASFPFIGKFDGWSQLHTNNTNNHLLAVLVMPQY